MESGRTSVVDGGAGSADVVVVVVAAVVVVDAGAAVVVVVVGGRVVVNGGRVVSLAASGEPPHEATMTDSAIKHRTRRREQLIGVLSAIRAVIKEQIVLSGLHTVRVGVPNCQGRLSFDRILR